MAFVTWTRFLVRDENGATMVEYAMVVTLIAMVAFFAVAALGGGVLSLFELVVFP